MIGYYHNKIGEFEKSIEHHQTHICFTCHTTIDQIFYRIRYLENPNHEVFKISFHYFPPCFNFDIYKGVQDCAVIADGYEIQTKFLKKQNTFSHQLIRIDRIISNQEHDKTQVSVQRAFIRTGKNAVTTIIRSEFSHRE